MTVSLKKITATLGVGVVIMAAIAPMAAAHGANEVSITTDGQYRYVIGNGMPDHRIGIFPNQNNPNTISAQNHRFRMPLDPTVAAGSTDIGMNPFGVGINGVPFDPSAAEFWNRDRNSGWQYEALAGAVNLGEDHANAHVQPGGAYHYHGVPVPIAARRADGHSTLVGWAADGFPIYAVYGYVDPDNPAAGATAQRSGYRVRQGTRAGGPGGSFDGSFVQDYEFVPGLGDLDVCNGKTTVTPDFPDGTYAYFLTETYPYIPPLSCRHAGRELHSLGARWPRRAESSGSRRPRGVRRRHGVDLARLVAAVAT